MSTGAFLHNMFGDTGEHLSKMIGATVSRVLIGEEILAFETDKGRAVFTVEGDCCSNSFFHDFYGVAHLLGNGPITEWEEVDLDPSDPGYVSPDEQIDYEYVQTYGYRFTTVHPVFGEVSSVFSFRNSSNGYYGGWMTSCDPSDADLADLIAITDDVTDVEALVARKETAI